MLIKTYPAIFYYEQQEGYTSGYYVIFPDIVGNGTQGNDLDDAMYMASDYLGIMLADTLEQDGKLPVASNIHDLSFEKNNPFKDDEDMNYSYDPDKSVITLVSVNLAEYLEMEHPVKKTLTIPKWADKRGRELGLNFSQTLTEAILSKSAT
jgi:predicted RNase H-like HicB family nuclease